MEREHAEVLRLLKVHGAVLERSKRHDVYRFPTGLIWVVPQSPSCKYAWKNALADLRAALGLIPVTRGQPGERRERKRKHDRPVQASPVIASGVKLRDWSAGLESVGRDLFGVMYDPDVMRVRKFRPSQR